MHQCVVKMCVCSVMSSSLPPHGLYRSPDFSVRGFFHARTLEWAAISSSRGSYPLRDQPQFLLHLLHWRADSLPLHPPWNTAAAAAAKSLQSCPTLCDPTDGSPPGSSVRGIFQARVLEWGAIAFSALEHYTPVKRNY